MTNLNDKIIKKVYTYETKRTASKIVILTSSFIFFAIVAFICMQTVFDSLIEHSSFDVLEIFEEDFEVIKMYFWEAVQVIYHDIPKVHGTGFLISFVALIVVLYLAIRNIAKVKNRLRAIISYRRKVH